MGTGGRRVSGDTAGGKGNRAEQGSGRITGLNVVDRLCQRSPILWLFNTELHVTAISFHSLVSFNGFVVYLHLSTVVLHYFLGFCCLILVIFSSNFSFM